MGKCYLSAIVFCEKFTMLENWVDFMAEIALFFNNDLFKYFKTKYLNFYCTLHNR